MRIATTINLYNMGCVCVYVCVCVCLGGVVLESEYLDSVDGYTLFTTEFTIVVLLSEFS